MFATRCFKRRLFLFALSFLLFGALSVVNVTTGPNITTFQQDVAPGKTFYYRIFAFTGTHNSGWSNTASVTTPNLRLSNWGGVVPPLRYQPGVKYEEPTWQLVVTILFSSSGSVRKPF